MTILSRNLDVEHRTFETHHGSGPDAINPVVPSAEFVLKTVDLIQINEDGVTAAARYIGDRLVKDGYTPRTWLTHPLHLCPPEPYDPAHPGTRATLDWIFLISSLNFSFWSRFEGTEDRFGIEWRDAWGSELRVVHTGYWSVVAALDRGTCTYVSYAAIVLTKSYPFPSHLLNDYYVYLALEEGIPITDPAFYSSETRCPDSLIDHIFRAAPQSKEGVPLLRERIAIMREVGSIMCTRFGGTFQGFIEEFQRRHNYNGTALQLVQMVTDTFPSFRDEHWLDGRRIFIWKRAQILAAETWAAFSPPSEEEPHPFFPHGIAQLTMFADYRVPQILHHLRLLTYPPALTRALETHEPFASGAPEELAIRAASIVAVERVAAAMRADGRAGAVSSVLIDFFLWDLAKGLEAGEDRIEGIKTQEMLPIHRTRSIWY
ncbi:hypothetical protein BC834DRAFT_581236 [Gloeopeniophorella convolvens]|nr:hypothetical protein BC834DRAFT_581236 [Gloeopeniophorella convolvens]